MTDAACALLDAASRCLLRPRSDFLKEAVLQWEPAEYVLAWSHQAFNEPHMCVLDPAGRYGIDLQEFFRTHRPVPHRAHHYVKIGTVRAWRVVGAGMIETRLHGRLETASFVEIGTWVVENPGGERYPISDEELARRYEIEAESETAPDASPTSS